MLADIASPSKAIKSSNVWLLVTALSFFVGWFVCLTLNQQQLWFKRPMLNGLNSTQWKKLPPNVTLITFQKNEFDIINEWMEYHTYIFGVENVILIDNFSDDKRVIESLKNWEQKGVKIIWDQGPYNHKGNLILQAGKNSKKDILIPIDIDEFLAIFDENGIPIISKDLILREVRRFQNSAFSSLGLRPYYNSISINTNDTLGSLEYFLKNSYTEKHAKKMVKTDHILKIDHGSHKIQFIDDTLYQQSSTKRLGYLHYHHRGPERTLQRALIDAIGFGYLPVIKIDQIHKYRSTIYNNIQRRVPGNHKLTQLLAYIDEGLNSSAFLYKGILPNVTMIRVPNISTILGTIKAGDVVRLRE